MKRGVLAQSGALTGLYRRKESERCCGSLVSWRRRWIDRHRLNGREQSTRRAADEKQCRHGRKRSRIER
jgi:hypothetical protein